MTSRLNLVINTRRLPAGKTHTLHDILRLTKAIRKSQFTAHNTLRREWVSHRSTHDQSRPQKWRSHPKFLIAVTLYSPLLLLCLFIVLHWDRITRDGSPLTATTSSRSAVADHHTSGPQFFFDSRMHDRMTCEMPRLNDRDLTPGHSSKTERYTMKGKAFALLSRPRTRICAAKWSCEWTEEFCNILKSGYFGT